MTSFYNQAIHQANRLQKRDNDKKLNDNLASALDRKAKTTIFPDIYFEDYWTGQEYTMDRFAVLSAVDSW